MININIKHIVPDENQPRKFFDAAKLGRLAKSLQKHGVINPLTVEQIGKDKYLLVDGERRYRAAQEIGLKEVPVNIVEPKSEMDRLIRQYHIQEQQEGWSPLEKAGVLIDLAEKMELSMEIACDLLGINSRTGSRYIAFAKLAERDLFSRSEMPVDYAIHIGKLKEFAKRISVERLDEKFIRSDEKNFERACITRFINGQISRPGDFSKLRDAFNSDPKSIKKFMTTDIGVEKIFTDTKGKAAYHLRNAEANGSYLYNHINRFLDNPAVKPTPESVDMFKRVQKSIDKLLAKIG